MYLSLSALCDTPSVHIKYSRKNKIKMPGCCFLGSWVSDGRWVAKQCITVPQYKHLRNSEHKKTNTMSEGWHC